MSTTIVREGLSLRDRRRLSWLIHESGAPYVVLIGSWARGTQESGVSDIDVLVGLARGEACKDQEGMHVVCIPPDQLIERATAGDDVALWCVRYGIPLSGRARWEQITAHILSSEPELRPEKKFVLAQRELGYAQELLGMGDLDGAREELRIGLGHLARGLLILEDVFPLSRPELPTQLARTKHAELGAVLTAVAESSLREPELHHMLDQALRLLLANQPEPLDH